MRTVTPSPEAQAFTSAVKASDPGALTACTGMTVHRLVVHVAAAYPEVIRHIDGLLEDDPVTMTRSFEEREEPFLSWTLEELIDFIVEWEGRLHAKIDAAVERHGDVKIFWTNRYVAVSSFESHLTMECAIHLWDIIGDTPEITELLAGEHLLDHTVNSVTAVPLTARGRAAGAGSGRPLHARVRVPRLNDVVVDVSGGNPALRIGEQSGLAAVEASDAAARLLMLWGRIPQPPHRLTSRDDTESIRLSHLFCGY